MPEWPTIRPISLFSSSRQPANDTVQPWLASIPWPSCPLSSGSVFRTTAPLTSRDAPNIAYNPALLLPSTTTPSRETADSFVAIRP